MKWSFAVLAALLLLLRPLCDVWAAGHVHAEAVSAAHSTALEDTHGANPHDGEPCCASLADAVPANSGDAGPITTAGEPQMAIAAIASISARYVAAAIPSLRKPPGVPPSSLSYYARSARIQR